MLCNLRRETSRNAKSGISASVKYWRNGKRTIKLARNHTTIISSLRTSKWHREASEAASRKLLRVLAFSETCRSGWTSTVSIMKGCLCLSLGPKNAVCRSWMQYCHTSSTISLIYWLVTHFIPTSYRPRSMTGRSNEAGLLSAAKSKTMAATGTFPSA